MLITFVIPPPSCWAGWPSGGSSPAVGLRRRRAPATTRWRRRRRGRPRRSPRRKPLLRPRPRPASQARSSKGFPAELGSPSRVPGATRRGWPAGWCSRRTSPWRCSTSPRGRRARPRHLRAPRGRRAVLLAQAGRRQEPRCPRRAALGPRARGRALRAPPAAAAHRTKHWHRAPDLDGDVVVAEYGSPGVERMLVIQQGGKVRVWHGDMLEPAMIDVLPSGKATLTT